MSRQREGFDLNRFLIRWGINAVAIWAAIRLVPGIHLIDNSIGVIITVALIFGLVNAIIRPVVAFLTCPLIILTLGLGTLLINAAMLALTGAISRAVGIGITFDGFWPVFWGALVISIVSVVLSALLGGKRRREED